MFFWGWVETVEKGENVGYQHFLLFSPCFSGSFIVGLKWQGVNCFQFGKKCNPMQIKKKKNQSVENADVAFFKGADERNRFFEKRNKQLYTTNKSGRTRQTTKNLSYELIWGLTPSGDKGWCIIAPIERYSGYRNFQ